MKQIFIVAIAAVVLSSCEKEINIDLNSADPKIVIEGNITDEPGPYFVKISKTVNFSDANNYPSVTGALVIISDNIGNLDTLSYVSNGIYITHTIIGQPGNTYNLQIVADGKNFYASSTMPDKVTLDSLRFNAFINQGTTNFMVIPTFTDPSELGNNYRFIQKVNSRIDKSYIVQNDIATNGTVNQLPIFSQGEDIEIKAGDTVTIEMRCIDINTYNYFFTLSQISGGFDGATPSNPPNNIRGDYALGFFAAYTTQKRTQEVH
jgi:hypothetical protein